MEVSYKVAQLAKEKGYFIWHSKRYVNGKLTYSPTSKYIIAVEGKRMVKPDQQQIFAPLQSELQTWLRDTYKIHIEPQYSFKSDYSGVEWWFYLYPQIGGGRIKFFPDEIGNDLNYEGALEAGLFEALKLINIETK